jgi:hypothetical protein
VLLLDSTVASEGAPRELSNEWSCLSLFGPGGISVSCPWWQKSPSVIKELKSYCNEKLHQDTRREVHYRQYGIDPDTSPQGGIGKIEIN